MDLLDSKAEQEKNLIAQAQIDKGLLRTRIYTKIRTTLMCSPVNQLEGNISVLTAWVLNLLGSETKGLPEEIFGLTPEQVYKVIHQYETLTGKKAEDL